MDGGNKNLAIEIHIGADLSFARQAVSESAFTEIQRQFRHANPQYQKMRKMGYAAVNEPKHYDTYSLERDKIRVWRGSAKRLKKILESHGHSVKWDDKRLVLPETGLDLGGLKLFDYQEPAANDLLRLHQGLLRGGTGSGKTETLLAAAVMSQQPALIQVWNKDLLKQWRDRIVKYGILKEHQIGLIQGSTNKVGPITLGMVQTLYKRVDQLKDKFGCVILDECQRAPANTFIKSVLPLPAKFRWGGSADETRKDRKEFLAYEAFGYQEWDEKGNSLKFYPLHEIVGGGQALEPTIVIVPTRYIDPEYEENRNYGQLINRLVVNEDRNETIAGHVKRSLSKGKQVILFTERVEAARYWASVVSEFGYEAGALIGGPENADETSATLERLRQGKCRFAATTSYADVGLDVPTLDTAFVTCPTAGNIKRMNQQVGRVVRPAEGKPDPVVFYFWDRGVSGVSRGTKNIKKRWKKVIQLD